VTAALKAKAELYNQIKSGKGDISALLQRGSCGDGVFLVDFEEKRRQPLPRIDDDCNANTSFAEGGAIIDTSAGIEDDSVEIEDEFGRSRTVQKRSREYQAYLQDQQIKKIKRGNDSSSGSQQYSAQQEQYPSGPWAWSSGRDRDDTAEWMRDMAEERGIKALVESRVEREISISDAARVKTQWEKTLKSSAKSFLNQVHKDAEDGRNEKELSKGSSGASRIEERRQMLLLKKAGKSANTNG
jgi:hypothetical protein